MLLARISVGIDVIVNPFTAIYKSDW